MPAEEPKYDDPTLPIPSYEEATSSRPHSSTSHRDQREELDNVESRGLLEQRLGSGNLPSRRHGNYHAPTVESGRSSIDSAFTSPEVDSEEEEALRQDLEQMEVTDPEGERRAQQRARLRQRFSKRISSITDLFSSLHFPTGRVRIPSFSLFSSHFRHIPDRYKPSWPIIARLAGLFIIVSLVYGLVAIKVFAPNRVLLGQQFIPESVRAFVQDRPDPAMMEKYLEQISYDDHIAGTKGDFFLAKWIEDRFVAAKLDSVWNEDFEVYLNYPRKDGRRVAIIDPPEKAWVAPLEENVLGDKKDQHQAAVFHGHSKSGNVTGPLVFANYGARADFEFLKSQGVNLTGTIALVKYYGDQSDRALKVKAAEMYGAAGCLIYSDPNEDGFRKGPTWPDGRWRTADGVQRGSVSLMSWVVGDVLTPGYASNADAERIPIENSRGLVNIPSLPLSWRDAQKLLGSITGIGRRVPENWVGGVPDIEWWTGNSSSSPIVHLKNFQDEVERQPIRNVIGRIEGTEAPEKEIYIGNHRDSWCFGAVDPGSGTAVMLDVVRIFGELLELGWRPRRTIVFASWDAEEYNLIGSTEHVEDRIKKIRDDGVAYLNIDTAVYGQEFWAAGSPVFEKPLLRVLDRVADPATNQTLLKLWTERKSKLEGLGAGSDYVAFQDLAGCSSLDFGFKGPLHGSPYHSCYETLTWMQRYGDPEFKYHGAMVQILALLVLELSDEPILGFDFNVYAREVTQYVIDLKTTIAEAADLDQYQGGNPDAGSPLNTRLLETAAHTFVRNAAEFMEWQEKWHNLVLENDYLESQTTTIERMSHNTRMSNFETHLLDIPIRGSDDNDNFDPDRKGGIPGREQFKHVIYGPQAWSGYDEAYFPAVRDAIGERDWKQAQQYLDIAAETLRRAAEKLLH